MPKMILLQQGQAVPYEVTKGETVLGRLPECDIQLQSNMVSRQHARLLLDGESVTLEDMKSGNGTFVNGQKIDRPVKLKTGDRIKFGPILFRFEGEGSSIEDESAARVVQAAAAMNPVDVDIAEEDDTNSTIMGAVDNAQGFGLLDVQPEAKLKAVLEISRSLAGTLDVEKMLPKILQTLFSVFPHADRGCILLQNAEGKMIPRAMLHRHGEEDSSVRLSKTILNQVLTEKKAILSADAASDSRFNASESISSLTIRSMMCVPLLSVQGEPLGVINIDTQNPFSQFKKEDLEILIAVAGQAALSYESARLLTSFIEKQKQDSEMQIARHVQEALLPDTLPTVEGYQFFASYDSAQAVGGDYYDVIPLKDGKLAIAFGDVAGKGVPGALVMSRISSVVRSTVDLVTDILETVARINEQMCVKAVEGRFVTFTLTILDTVNHKMQLVNAGHMSPIIRSTDNSLFEFDDETIGVPIAVMEGFPFEVVEHDLAPGDQVVLYTDGVSEAMNRNGDLYGMERLRAVVTKTHGDAASLGKVIREDVRAHAAGFPQNDDITLMVFGRNPT